MEYNVGMYLRLSRDDGKIGESNSIASQRNIIEKYCEQYKNFTIVNEYIDDGFTGTNFNRPGFNKLLEDIENKKINCVITKDLSRLGRDYLDAGNYIQKYFPQYGIRYIAVNDNYDSCKAGYDLMVVIKNLFNEQYSRDISKKVQSGMRARAEQGLFIGSHACYGYKKSKENKNKLVIDEEAAIVVKRIFNLYLQGYPKTTIAKILNNDNILCPTEYKRINNINYKNPNKLKTTSYWTNTSINAILRQENYTGTLVQCKKNTSRYTFNKKINEDDWIRVPNSHKPIIDTETFNKVQELLKLKTRKSNFNENIGIFAGLIRCGDCGRALIKSKEYRQYNGKKYNYISYRCRTYKQYGKDLCSSHRIGYNALVDVILNDINELIYKLNNIDKIIEKIAKNDKKIDEHKKRISIMEEDLKRLKIKKMKAYSDYTENLLTKDEYICFKNDIITKEQGLNKAIKYLNIEPKDRLHTLLSNEVIRKLYNKEKFTEEDLTREMVTELIKSIVVYENKETKEKTIEITYTFSNELELLN